MGPIVFVLIFLLIPLAAALFGGVFFAAAGILRLLAGVPTAAWAALAVAGVVVLAARVWAVLRTLRSPA